MPKHFDSPHSGTPDTDTDLDPVSKKHASLEIEVPLAEVSGFILGPHT